jgi:hypothetical protein
LSGEHVLPQRVPISEGWNLVGLFHNAVVTSGISSDPPGIIDSQVYDHLGKNDETVSVLAPGHAYWVRATADGYLVYSNAANNSAIAQ